MSKTELHRYLQTGRAAVRRAHPLGGIRRRAQFGHVGHAGRVARGDRLADIIRETIDGAIGHTLSNANLPSEGEAWWTKYRRHLEDSARAAAERWEN